MAHEENLEDLREQKRQLEEELDRLKRVESLGYLTASVIHDFNNLLTPLVCLSAMLTRELDKGSAAREMAAEMRETSERAAGLVRQMLSFVRRAPEAPRRLALGAVVTELRRLLERVVGEDVELVLAVDEDAGDVLVNREQLEQVLLNLAVNARDAMPRGGRLFVSTTPVTLAGLEESEPRQSGAYVALRVSDTGIGMSAEVRERLFERFFTTKPYGEGSGLGLAAAHRFAKGSGGFISVRSGEGAGTTVTLCLPRVEASAATTPPPSYDLLPRGAETILVVEDDGAVRSCVCAVLEAQGYRVLVAASGAEALEIAERQGHAIDLLLTDVIMPKMSGREVADALEAAGHTMRVLFMSGHTDAAIRERGVDPNADPFLRKAFAPSALITKVRDTLAEGVNALAASGES
jgi:nitrogen-specific signal transduction histidine kinase/ActR/RegA family two-component response regulator